ncbi:MAG: Periplasmic serine protease, DO/DeqQ family [Myxococcales bacterium]|jgi:hypothetical protein|nr:Periplasmic serine protease, DO/DeqQ family [Myxococcales bacterium]
MRTFVGMGLAFVVSVLAGCGGAAALPPVSTAAQAVRIGKADPSPGMKEVGPIEAIHGEGCGAMGNKGSYEGALAVLKNKAASDGADYVQIFTMTEPHSESGCFDQTFKIRGMAFKGGTAPP